MTRKVDFARPAAAQRPSRIRREPQPPQKPQSLEKALWRRSREWEIGLALVGIVLFALAINAMVFDFSWFLGS